MNTHSIYIGQRWRHRYLRGVTATIIGRATNMDRWVIGDEPNHGVSTQDLFEYYEPIDDDTLDDD